MSKPHRRPVVFTRLTSSLLVLGVLILLPLGCDSSDPEEEEVLITRVELLLLRTDVPDEAERIIASVQGDQGLMAGASIAADTLRFVPGTTYEGRIDLFDAAGQNITGQVRQEAENYQLFYTPEGANGIGVVVTDVESDYGGNEFGGDLRVGLAYTITVLEEAPGGDNGHLRLQVGQFGSGRKNGSTLTVAPIVDVRLPMVIVAPPVPVGPGTPEPITRAVLTLARTDGTETWTASVESLGGLGLGENITPSSLEIEMCAIDTGGTATCTDEEVIMLVEGEYEGQWDLFDEATGTQLNEEITAEADWHQFFYSVNFGPNPFTFQDTDSNGLPLGLSFLLTVPRGVGVLGGSFTVNLRHYDPARGEVKDGQRASLASDMSFMLPLQVSPVGLPELITRAVLTLQRADTSETITLTAMRVEGLRIEGAEPDSLVVETCTGPLGQQECTTGRTLSLASGATYTGTVEIFNDVTGEPVMEEIMNESFFHQFFYLGDLAEAFTITDTDPIDLPLGFNFRLDVPANTGIDAGIVQVILGHYEPGPDNFKDGVRLSAVRDLDFSVQLVVP